MQYDQRFGCYGLSMNNNGTSNMCTCCFPWKCDRVWHQDQFTWLMWLRVNDLEVIGVVTLMDVIFCFVYHQLITLPAISGLIWRRWSASEICICSRVEEMILQLKTATDNVQLPISFMVMVFFLLLFILGRLYLLEYESIVFM